MEFFLGISGVVVGAMGQILIDHLRHRRETQKQTELDAKRKFMLQKALEHPPPGKEWRELSTLSKIIGADFETTTRLLIEMDARGSEAENDVWALASKKPIGAHR